MCDFFSGSQFPPPVPLHPHERKNKFYKTLISDYKTFFRFDASFEKEQKPISK